MKLFPVFAVLTLLLVAHPAPAAEFLSAIDDLPLVEGLTEEADAGMAFDSPAGRIVEAFASGPVERSGVLKFYADTLPQLGWQPAGDGVFKRDGEVLKLEFPDTDPGTSIGTLVRFSLSPDG